jgi:hypothetical protein
MLITGLSNDRDRGGRTGMQRPAVEERRHQRHHISDGNDEKLVNAPPIVYEPI